MLFFLSLLIEGSLAGALYALIALGFVIVYKASRVVNLALGEWLMLASLLVAIALNMAGLGLPLALVAGVVGMVGFAWAFNGLVLSRLVGQPLISLLMVTLGLGVLLRGAAQLFFSGVPRQIELPIPIDPIVVGGLYIPSDRLAAAVVALLVIAAVSVFQARSRTGVALRAMADDQQAAMAVGIDVGRHVLLVWCLAGGVCVLAGTLWSYVTGGGFGVGLVGLKIFPIVIIGGLDSIQGTIIAAIFIGIVESLATGYLEPYLGGGCGLLAAYVALIAMLAVRPYGLFGTHRVERV